MVLTWQPEERIRLGGHTNTDQTVLGLLVYLCFPVVDIVLLRYRQVAQHSTFRIEKLDLGSTLDKAVCDFQLRFELPGRDALFLDSEVLR